MRRYVGLAFLWLVVSQLVAGSARAQTCPSLTDRRFDSHISYGATGGFYAPRWVHHAIGAGVAVGGVEFVHRTTKVSRRKLAWLPPLASIGLHVLGASRGHYGITWRDWMFDAGVRTLPLVLTSRDKPLALGLWGATYTLGVCVASP